MFKKIIDMKLTKQNLIGRINRAEDLAQLEEAAALFKKHFGQFNGKARKNIMHALVRKQNVLKAPKKKSRIKKIQLALATTLWYLFVIYILRFEFEMSLLWSFLIGIVVSFFSLVIIGLINHYKK